MMRAHARAEARGRPRSSRPTTCSPSAAMIACREAGVRIPDDISITGVDNTDLGATQTPALTSIRTPIVEIGRAAAEQLVARLEGRPREAFQTLPFELVRRGSRRAAAARALKGAARCPRDMSRAGARREPHVRSGVPSQAKFQARFSASHATTRMATLAHGRIEDRWRRTRMDRTRAVRALARTLSKTLLGAALAASFAAAHAGRSLSEREHAGAAGRRRTGACARRGSGDGHRRAEAARCRRVAGARRRAAHAGLGAIPPLPHARSVPRPLRSEPRRRRGRGRALHSRGPRNAGRRQPRARDRSAQAMESAFGTPLHQFDVPAHGPAASKPAIAFMPRSVRRR